MEGEFVVVKRKSKSRKQLSSSSKTANKFPPKESRNGGAYPNDHLKSKNKINNEEEVMKLVHAVKCSSDGMQGTNFFREITDHIQANMDADTKIMEIVCYGIGNFHSSNQSKLQLAFIVGLIIHLQIQGNVHIFDPVLTGVEQKAAEMLGFTLIMENEEGKRAVHCNNSVNTSENKGTVGNITGKTLFYMPHCAKGLYKNLLWKNWQPQILNKILILGNSFSSYSERLININADQLLYDYVERITPFVLEIPLPAYSQQEVFNDLSLLFFKQSILDQVSILEDASFWINCPEPVCTDSEIIH